VSRVRVATAQLPAPPDGADRILVTDRAVIVLDGASAHAPQDVSAAAYTDGLGARSVEVLQQTRESDLREVLAEAIAGTAQELGIAPAREHRPARSPSVDTAVAIASAGPRR
jgi:hypothetical protein